MNNPESANTTVHSSSIPLGISLSSGEELEQSDVDNAILFEYISMLIEFSIELQSVKCPISTAKTSLIHSGKTWS